MSELKYKEGDVVRIDGDGTEYEVVSAVIPPNLNIDHYVLAPKWKLDEQRGGPAEPTNEEGPENDEVPSTN